MELRKGEMSSVLASSSPGTTYSRSCSVKSFSGLSLATLMLFKRFFAPRYRSCWGHLKGNFCCFSDTKRAVIDRQPLTVKQRGWTRSRRCIDMCFGRVAYIDDSCTCCTGRKKALAFCHTEGRCFCFHFVNCACSSAGGPRINEGGGALSCIAAGSFSQSLIRLVRRALYHEAGRRVHKLHVKTHLSTTCYRI